MTKTILLTGILFFFYITAKAQEHNSRFSVEVSAGPSFPVGNFASKDTLGMRLGDSNTSGGWAKTGLVVNLSASYNITRVFGWELEVGGQFNKRDGAPLKKVLRKIYATRDNLRISVKGSSWKIGKILTGGFFAVPLSSSDKFYFQGKVLAGVCKTSIPEYQYAVYDKDNPMGNPDGESVLTAGRHSKTSLPLTFCYQLGAGLKYLLTQKMFLTASINYFDAQPVRKYSVYADPMNPGGERIEIEKKYKLRSINPMVGIGLTF